MAGKVTTDQVSVSTFTPEGAAHLETVLVPKLMKDFEYQIYRDPDRFLARESVDLETSEKTDTLTQLVATIEDEVFFPLKDIVETNRVDTDIDLKSLIRVAGAGVILKDKVEADAGLLTCIITTRNAIANFLGNTLDACREQCATVQQLDNSFSGATTMCIAAVKKSKDVWKNGLEAGLKTLAKGL